MYMVIISHCVWYNQECRVAYAVKDSDYRNTLRSIAKPAAREWYRKREKKLLFRRNKSEAEKKKLDVIAMTCNRNEARSMISNL